MIRKTLPLVFLLLLSVSLSARTHIDGGLAIGRQSYANPYETPQYILGVETLARRGNVGVHLAADTVTLKEYGTAVSAHLDGIYRQPFATNYFVLGGAGLTYTVLDSNVDPGWNAELEIGRSSASKGYEIYLGARTYDFVFEQFRSWPASPTSPAVYLGARFALRK
jgi:hypothetical protein